MSDVGLEVVEHVYRLMNIDEEWSDGIERGFVWWGRDLAQRVWAEPCFEDHGFVIARVHARTDLVAGFADDDDRLARLAPHLWGTPLSGLIQDKNDPTRLQLACSLYVHSASGDWLQRVFGLATAVQAALAHERAGALARAVGGRVASSAHPRSGRRREADDMLNVMDAVVAPEGKGGPLFNDDDLHEAWEALNEWQFPSVIEGRGLTAQLPFGDDHSLLHVAADGADPRAGHGLTIRLSSPVGAGDADISAGVRLALALNGRELEDFTHTHFLGSWGPGPGGLTHTAFYPNAMLRFSPGCAVTLVHGAVHRARWVAREVLGRPWEEADADGAIRQACERLREMSDDEIRAAAEEMARAERQSTDPAARSAGEIYRLLKSLADTALLNDGGEGAAPGSHREKHKPRRPSRRRRGRGE